MIVTLPAHYYQQFDVDFTLDVPGEGFGGWKKADLPMDLSHTALVVMHAWQTGARQEYPGWHRAVEYIPRAEEICQTVFPRFLTAVRASEMKLFHVVYPGPYCKNYPGYKKSVELAGPEPVKPEKIQVDATAEALRRFQYDHVCVGRHNEEDVIRGFKNLDFHPESQPMGDEGIAENRYQLLGLCKHHQISHLIYVGFAINWCLLLASGGIAEMNQHGLLCSTIRQAVTAVENKETVRRELCKEEGLWRVSVAYGFVYDVDNFIQALSKISQ
jgi:hypothetical protein